MSRCRLHIIASSTFIWWRTWLARAADTRAITPLKWFNELDLDTSDLLPPAWILA